MKLLIGNRSYSSWSLRGWLILKQAGLPFETELVPMYGEEWAARKAKGDLAPSQGKVPILWDGDSVVWDSHAILDMMADRVGQDRFWPKDPAARALARSMVGEMHSSYAALRDVCTMNVRRRIEDHPLTDAARADADRIIELWAQARARFGNGGPYLFGTFSAADIMFAPVVWRFHGYHVPLPGFAQAYVEAMLDHPWMIEWHTAAMAEPWVLDHYEF